MDRLDKGQASSHPELAKCKPEDLFHPPQVKLYKQLHADLWDRFIQVHGTILTLEKLADFPFNYLYGPNDMEFWRLVIVNFYEIACLKLDGLVSDTGSDAHSIIHFKNTIMKWDWRDPEKHVVFRQILQRRKFDQQTISIANRVHKIRNIRIAHRLLDSQSSLLQYLQEGINLGDLRQLFDAAHALFGAISFGSAYCTLPMDFMSETIGGQRKRSCLDQVLDAALRDSDFVNYPERRAQYWKLEREHWPPQRLRVMNQLRQRIGLPEE